MSKELSQSYIDQLWGEAVNLYKHKLFLETSQRDEELLELHRAQFKYSSPIEDRLRDLLDSLPKEKEYITSEELADSLSIKLEGKEMAIVKHLMINEFKCIAKRKIIPVEEYDTKTKKNIIVKRKRHIYELQK